MEAIYYGVLDAFNYNSREAREVRAEATVSETKAIADALKPISDLLALLGESANDGKYPTIRRAK